MNNQGREDLMAFMEGEMGPLQANRMASRLQNERRLRDAWENQYWISFLLQNDRTGTRWASPGFADRIAARIADEPSILAPRASGSRRVLGPFWMKAGAVAAVLVVSVTLVGLLPRNTLSSGQVDPVPAGHYNSQTALLSGTQGTQEVFHLRPVGDFNVKPTGPDLMIQRDIKRLWIPGQSNYLPVSASANYANAGTLQNTVYNSTAGISNISAYHSAGGYP
ncbi:sigma-E factor negative regulatory protein [Acidithiobacillus sp. M4-SHS-6]|uniref:sigma-E factor negative regulatory protein n=1 Tax=Acidithiobacillus sp. M4-SHS-6 TaxID=3383024 RepID=UPI0039BE9B30